MIKYQIVLLQWFVNFLIKNGGGIKNENMSNKELEENCTNQLLENLKK